MELRDYEPRPAVVRPETTVQRPKFPVIDAHNHLGKLTPDVQFGSKWQTRPVGELIDELDSAGVERLVDLDGQWDDVLKREIDRYARAFPGRFAVFTGLDYSAFSRPDFGDVLADRVRRGIAAGARGVKVWKPLGLSTRDAAGRRVSPDDPRLRGAWQAAAEAGVPVLVHVADPVAFFDPLDATNERWEELQGHPDWHFPSPAFPSFATIIEEFANLVRSNPKTTFIGAHVACYAENLGWVRNLLTECPNLVVDFSARVAELGRVPHAARKLFLDFPTRIVFGTDLPADRRMYALHYRFLETPDEYFPYWLGDGNPPQGRWMVYGLNLPDDVLKAVYRENALRVIRF